MRQIKFRGKRKDTGEWVHGDLQLGDGDHIPMIGEVVCGHDPYYVQVQEDTIGQFTGLYDKDGSPIYEGDVLQTNPTPHGRGYVRWHDKEAHFVVQMLLNEQWYGIAAGVVEICGNIHDNPELINSKQ